MPPIADKVLPSSRGLGELRSEPLDPPVHGDVIDLDPALREELFDVSVGKSEPQVPPDRQGDDLRREPEPSEGRGRGWTGARVPVRSHGASLPDADASANATVPVGMAPRPLLRVRVYPAGGRISVWPVSVPRAPIPDLADDKTYRRSGEK